MRTLVLLLLILAAPVSAGPEGRVRVIDADTWDVAGERVRIFGIDAPELDQTCAREDGRDWSCGLWAREEARARFEGREARCEAVTRDRYGRTVARCEVAGVDAGRAMVQGGLALAYRRYSMLYDLDEKVASVSRAGIHQGAFERPETFRRAPVAAVPAPAPAPDAPKGCAIKGNVSGKGERIYHVPGQEHYARTRISVAKGERWFCSEVEARAAGWRRARR